MRYLSAMSVALMLTCAAASPAQADDLRDAVAQDLPSLIALYRDLHANPELSFQELGQRQNWPRRRAGWGLMSPKKSAKPASLR